MDVLVFGLVLAVAVGSMMVRNRQKQRQHEAFLRRYDAVSVHQRVKATTSSTTIPGTSGHTRVALPTKTIPRRFANERREVEVVRQTPSGQLYVDTTPAYDYGSSGCSSSYSDSGSSCDSGGSCGCD